MRYSDIKKIMASWSMLVLSVFLPGCDDTGEAMHSPAIGSLRFQTYVMDPLSFRVYVNDNLMGAKKQFKYFDHSIRLKIVEDASGRVIFDGDYPVHPQGGTQVVVTVCQFNSGSVPFCVLPPADEPVPPAGYGKISIHYNFPGFPDSLKAVIENTTTATSNAYTPTDSLIVRKNEFSRFFLGRFSEKKAQIRLYTAGGSRTRVATVEASMFYNIGREFSMYMASGVNGTTIPNVTLTRVY
jgi:hypothetical protein